MKHELPTAPWSYRRSPDEHMEGMDMWEINHGSDTECVAENVYGEDAARLIASAPKLLAACDRTPNPSGTGTMSNYHILLMAITALRAEGHKTLATELEAIQNHQREAVAKATSNPS